MKADFQRGCKRCARCKVEKSLAEFHKNASTIDGFFHYCKLCGAEYYSTRHAAARVATPTVRQARAVRNAELAKLGQKSCSLCHVEKAFEDFYPQARNRDGKASWCKACSNQQTTAHAKNPANRQKRLGYSRAYYQRIREQDPGKLKDNQRAYLQIRRDTDPNYAIKHAIGNSIRDAIKEAGAKKDSRTEELLGCPVSELRKQFEAQFLPGMTWENHGSVWHIGHRQPCASFDLTDPVQQRECWNYTNLFPHWADANLCEGAKVGDIDFKYLKAQQYVVIPVPLENVRALIEKHHYAGAAPSAASRCFGLVRKEDPEARLIGAAVFRPAPLGAAKKECPADPQRVICLSRLVVVPELPTNAASYLLGRALRALKQEGAWTVALTYADQWQEHTGAIYRATNWEYVGLSSPQPVWLLNGKLTGKRLGNKSRSNKDMRELGATFEGKFAKHVFRYRF